jgi:hypothetical protein
LKEWDPNLDLLPWLFESIDEKIWENKENHRRYFDWLFKELNLSKMSDWYTVPVEEVLQRKGKYFPLVLSTKILKGDP